MRPLELLELDELSEEDEVLELSVLLLEPLELSVLLLELVPLLADVSAPACNVPTRANTPAAAASVTAAARDAVRRVPLRTAAAAPRSLVVMTVPLP
ncbi:hypothetical protein ACFY1L_33880 [Streptomyces sp. NPDC001663]|uniref:hypothetical protein n=1 Tax=Streptomyces sp. NPDC001663 TaxID=3364597 RepID=UPI00369B4CBC